MKDSFMNEPLISKSSSLYLKVTILKTLLELKKTQEESNQRLEKLKMDRDINKRI